MWIRYWANFKYNSGHDSLNEEYFWFDTIREYILESVKEWAESTFDYQGQQNSDRIWFDYDYESDAVIPENIRQDMIKENLSKIELAVSNLTHLGYKNETNG